MYEYLEAAQSSYFLALRIFYAEIKSSLEEAQDILDYLTPLISHFETLETIEFLRMHEVFNPLFHTICLVWSQCKHYCKPNRIVVLIQEINNLIIMRITQFLEPDELFKTDHYEASNKLDACLFALNTYYECFNQHKDNIRNYFKNGLPAREWTFCSSIAFGKYDKFLKKINTIRVNKYIFSK